MSLYDLEWVYWSTAIEPFWERAKLADLLVGLDPAKVYINNGRNNGRK